MPRGQVPPALSPGRLLGFEAGEPVHLLEPRVALASSYVYIKKLKVGCFEIV